MRYQHKRDGTREKPFGKPIPPHSALSNESTFAVQGRTTTHGMACHSAGELTRRIEAPTTIVLTPEMIGAVGIKLGDIDADAKRLRRIRAQQPER
jgi:hypothetical protein